MKLIRLTMVASAVAAIMAAGMAPAHAAVQQLPVSANEAPNLWFVEFNSAPTTEGTDAAKVQGEHVAFKKAAAAAGVKFKTRRAFNTLFNGLSVEVSPAERLKLARVAGVKALYPMMVFQAPNPVKSDGSNEANMATALAMTGADVAQNTLGLSGKGVKVGIIDTGIDLDHPDLGGTGVQGASVLPTSRVKYGYDFVGDAFNADPSSPAYNPVTTPDDNPDDCAGHGTHVAGIVGASGAIKGVAPNVTLGAYRVFGCAGSTTADVMIAAMERALADGMQVINMSIGSSFQWPEYPSAKAADRMVRKGMIVVASIGNSGTSGLYAAGAPGVGKNVIGVASYDNSHVVLRQFGVTGSSGLVGFSDATGAPAAPTSGGALMARTGTTTTANDACAALPAGSLSGKIALIRRGTCGFYVKATNAQAAGAVGVVLYNNAAGPLSPSVAGSPAITIPVVGVSDVFGASIDTALQAGEVTLTWANTTGSYPNPTGNLISSFSSYGLAADLSLKPNIGAPGGLINSTWPLEQGGYATLSGTSMSSPNVAGTVALLLEARPGLSPAAVKERLQNSADPKMWSGNPAAGYLDMVHRQGAGMTDVVGAVLQTTTISPSELALGESEAGPATRTLTLRNTSKTSVTYTLSHTGALSTGPNSFTLAFSGIGATVSLSATSVTVPPKGTATVDVTITAPATLPDTSIYGGYIVATSTLDGKVLRVPYAGMKGDYQSKVVLTPTANGFPWLAQLVGSSYQNRATGGTFTMANGDIPYMLMHFDHHARQVRLSAFDANTGKSWFTVSKDNFLPRSSTATAFSAFQWDGRVVRGDSAPITVPNGQYVIKVEVLKALGDETNPAHWETWTTPVITIARPVPGV